MSAPPPERWRHVSQLYHAALACQGDREAFLEHACAGDEALRRAIRPSAGRPRQKPDDRRRRGRKSGAFRLSANGVRSIRMSPSPAVNGIVSRRSGEVQGAECDRADHTGSIQRLRLTLVLSQYRAY